MSVGILAAQMAAGSGDSTVEFTGDAGVLRSRDLSAALNVSEDLSKASASNPSGAAGGASKARKALNAVAMKDKMVSLRAEVLDTLSLLESMVDDTANRTKAMHRRMNESHVSEVKHVETFDDGFVHLDIVGFDVPRAIREGDLGFDMAFFQQYGLPVRTPTAAFIKKKFLDLESKLYSGKEAVQMTADIRRDITKLLFPLGDANFPEMLLSLNNFTMTDVIGTIKVDLLGLQDPITELTRNLELTLRDKDAAQEEQKMDVAESLDLASIDLCAKRLEVHVKRIGLLCSNEGGGIMASLELVTKNPDIPRLLAEKQRDNDTATSDLRKLDLDHIEKLKENESTISRYNNTAADSKRKIRANHATQHQTWAEIEHLLEKMAALQRDDQALVREHVRVTEVEQKRRQEHREYRESYATHRMTLEDMIANTAAGSAFVQDLQSATERGKEKIIAAAIEDQLKMLLRQERKSYHTAFEAYSTHAGKSLSRYDKKSVAIDQMISDLNYMKKHAIETNDDQGAAYGRRVTDLEKQQRKARKIFDKLMTEYEAKESEFYTLERTFKRVINDTTAGEEDQGTKLVEMLLKYRADSLTKLITQMAQLASNNMAVADESRSRIMQLASDASIQRDAVNERRAASGAKQLETSESSIANSTLNVSNIDVQEQ